MDVNSVINSYNMNSLWNSLNSNSTYSSISSIENVDSAVKENSTELNYFGEDINAQLQDIYQHVEPTYGIPLTYSKSGDLSISSDAASSTSELNNNDSNIISLLQGNNSNKDVIDSSILSQYNTIRSGQLQDYMNAMYSSSDYNTAITNTSSNFTSILSSKPNDVYTTINSLTNASAQSMGNYLNAVV